MPERVIIIAGPNGAGKTTFAKEFLPNEAKCPIFVNADSDSGRPFAVSARRVGLSVRAADAGGDRPPRPGRRELRVRNHPFRPELRGEDPPLAQAWVPRQADVSVACDPRRSHRNASRYVFVRAGTTSRPRSFAVAIMRGSATFTTRIAGVSTIGRYSTPADRASLWKTKDVTSYDRRKDSFPPCPSLTIQTCRLLRSPCCGRPDAPTSSPIRPAPVSLSCATERWWRSSRIRRCTETCCARQAAMAGQHAEDSGSGKMTLFPQSRHPARAGIHRLTCSHS